jgi:hypothetical protein
MAAYNYIWPSLTEKGQAAERLQGLAVTSDFFPVLGVQPLFGRVFGSSLFARSDPRRQHAEMVGSSSPA